LFLEQKRLLEGSLLNVQKIGTSNANIFNG
jgi:hypothetical protein